MIPYIHIPTIQLGPLIIHTWGFFVSLGFLTAIAVAYREAKHQNLDSNKLLDLAFWLILGAVLGSRFSHVFFYEPQYYFGHPLEILKIWQGGLSSFGGFFGGLFAGWLYTIKKRLNFWQWTNLIAFVLPLGWGIGRLGCFLTHLHPGIQTDFFLAVAMPDGPRLEMGLIEAIFSFLLFGYFLITRRRAHFSGFYIVNFALIYGLGRFFLDFFRINDARYFNLTPAQYGSLFLIVLGVYTLVYRRYS